MSSFTESIDRWLLTHSSIPLSQKVFFTENLRVMVKAGLSLGEALNTLALQAESKFFRRVITSVKDDVESGKLMSQSLGKFPKVFPNIFINMIQIGEVSGTLEQTLEELTQQMKKDYTLRSKVKGAMTYPIVIMVAMLGITAGLFAFVLPKLIDVFKEAGNIQLPLPTRILIATSDFVQANGILVIVGFIAVIFAVILFYRTPVGRRLTDTCILLAPLLGPIAKKVNLARFSRTLSGLLRTDIPVVQALTVTSDVLGNTLYNRAAKDAAEYVKRGENISRALGAYPKLFPPLVIQMVMVGERSGNVDSLLGDVADFYEQQVDQVVSNLSSIIEPILILFLGGAVGGIALAVMMPMYSLGQAISEQ
ncbi:MAG: type II secretion system F family protein [Patescibacteria group bacterium]|nr:type II secretion system F family protein [Patescibacteria group bacterium]